MPQMQTDFEGLIQLLARNLYPEPDVFIRELIQNAHDAIKIRRIDEPRLEGRIDITIDTPNRVLFFLDNGVGMDEADLEHFLSTIGVSGTKERAEKYLQEGDKKQALGTIGQFGIGVLSAFVVADRIEVLTRKLGSNMCYRWDYQGKKEYQLEVAGGHMDVGTCVKVTLNTDRLEYLDSGVIKKTVKRYADFIPFRIDVNGDGPINSIDAPWHKGGWAGQHDYIEALSDFLNKRFPDSPLLVIPVNLDTPNASGALYVSDRHVPGINTAGLLDIFQERMCIRVNDSELLPEWAQFVRGVVDSPALTPTAARDNVQKDGAYYDLRRCLGRLIVDALVNLAKSDKKSDRDKFDRLCSWHHYHLKGMALHFDDFFTAVIDWLPFETNEGRMNLPTYIKRQRAKPGERVPVYFFSYGGDSNQFYDLCQARGLVVINTGFAFDEEVLRKYAERNQQKLELRRMDALDDADLYEHLSVEERARFLAVEAALSRALLKVGTTQRVEAETRRFSPSNMSGALISRAEFDRQQALEGAFRQIELHFGGELAKDALEQLRSHPLRLFLNADNPLVRRLSNVENISDSRYDLLLVGLYNAAIIYSQQMSPQNARVIYSQFQKHMLDALELSEEVTALRAERVEGVAADGRLFHETRTWVRLFIMMSYEHPYAPVEEALRRIFQGRPYFFEVVLAKDGSYEQEIRKNLQVVISNSDGFVADISERSPNVFLELGWTRLDPMFTERPIILLRSRASVHAVPVDLADLACIEYVSPTSPRVVQDLSDAFERNQAIQDLLRDRKAKFLSRDLLASWLPVKGHEEAQRQICARYKTLESIWESTDADFQACLSSSFMFLIPHFRELQAHLKTVDS